jgi:uncharacterized protein DUF262
VVTKLEAHERQVSKVLCTDYDFAIPAYQRPYAWEPEQAQELLEDLSHALDHSSQEPYFLGSIVLVKPEDDPQCDVIDGQQRLTTLTILRAVLRELSQNEKIRQGLNLQIWEPATSCKRFRPNPLDATGTVTANSSVNTRRIQVVWLSWVPVAAPWMSALQVICPPRFSTSHRDSSDLLVLSPAPHSVIPTTPDGPHASPSSQSTRPYRGDHASMHAVWHRQSTRSDRCPWLLSSNHS